MRQAIIETLEEDSGINIDEKNIDDKIEQAKKSSLSGFARIMMTRHGLDHDAALRMVVECCDLRRPYLLSFLKGEIPRDEYLKERDAVDDYIIRKYAGMLH